MTKPTLGFIGAGNMATCMIRGLIQQGYPQNHIWASNRNPSKLAELSSTMGILTCEDNQEMCQHTQILFLCVKPQHIKTVCAQLAPCISPSHTCISIAAGITTVQILNWLQSPHLAICRAMPNTPALFGQGITGLYFKGEFSNTQIQRIDALFKSMGQRIIIEEESLMDVVTAVSGSGPAYVYTFLSHLIEGAQDLGLSESQARQLSVHTLKGALAVIEHSPLPLNTLISQVTSKGGTTEAGLAAFKAGQFKELIQEVLRCATERGKTLSQQFDEQF